MTIYQKIFNSFKNKDNVIDTPLEEKPWQEIVEGFYDKELEHHDNIFGVIYNDDKMKRAVITHKINGLYVVNFESLQSRCGSGDDDYLKDEIRITGGCWRRESMSMFDTSERAINSINQCYGLFLSNKENNKYTV